MEKPKDIISNIEYLGDLSMTPAGRSRYMVCYECMVSWNGCWDAFECPKCGAGELPSANVRDLSALPRRVMK